MMNLYTMCNNESGELVCYRTTGNEVHRTQRVNPCPAEVEMSFFISFEAGNCD